MHEPYSDNSNSCKEVIEWLEVVHRMELLHVDYSNDGLNAEHYSALPDAENQLNGRTALRHVRSNSQTVNIVADQHQFVLLKIFFNEVGSILHL